jgi:integrase
VPRHARKALQDAECRSAAPSEKARKLYDADGLFFEVMPTGYKRWRMKFSYAGKQCCVTLGEYAPDDRGRSGSGPKLRLTLADARKEVRRLRVMLDEGRNPAVEKRVSKIEQRALTAATFADLYAEWFAASRPKWSDSYATKISNCMARNILPALGSLPVSRISAPIVLDTLRTVERRGALDLVKFLRRLTRQVLDHGIATGCLAGENPVRALMDSVFKAHQPTKMPTFQNRADAGSFLRALTEYEGRPETRIALEMLAHTAVRPGELRGALWAEFDTPNGLWRIPAGRMKSSREHVVPLTEHVIRLMDELRPMSGHSKWLFPGMSDPTQPISEATVGKAMRTLWKAYRVVPHGWRAFFSTQANEDGRFRWDVIEAALAHAEKNAVRGAYNRASYLRERRELADWWSLELLSMRRGAAVVDLATARTA